MGNVSDKYCHKFITACKMNFDKSCMDGELVKCVYQSTNALMAYDTKSHVAYLGVFELYIRQV